MQQDNPEMTIEQKITELKDRLDIHEERISSITNYIDFILTKLIELQTLNF